MFRQPYRSYFARLGKLKYLFLSMLIVIASLGRSTAQTESGTLLPDDLCGDMSFVTVGDFLLTSGEQASYTMVTSSLLDQQARTEYELRSGDRILEVAEWRQFATTFTTTGTYLLKAFLRRSDDCVQVQEYPVSVVDHLWLAIGIDETSQPLLQQMARQGGKELAIINSLSNTPTQEMLLSRLQHLARLLSQAEVVILDQSQANTVFTHLQDISAYGTQVPDRIILVGTLASSALRRLLQQSPTVRSFQEIAVVPATYISTVLQTLLLQEPLESLKVVEIFHPAGQGDPRRLPISRLVDQLIAMQVSVSFLIFVLILPFLILAIAILKQIGGISFWWLYYVLLLAAAGNFFGRDITALLFVAALAGHLITQSITERLYLLYVPKTWFSLALTSLLFLVIYLILKQLLPQLTIPNDPLTVFFPLATISLMMQHIAPDHKTLLTYKRRSGFIQFIGVTLIVRWLLNRQALHQLVLSMPERTLLALGGIFLVGRYTWLQISEYLTFRPLIKQQLNDTEEE